MCRTLTTTKRSLARRTACSQQAPAVETAAAIVPVHLVLATVRLVQENSKVTPAQVGLDRVRLLLEWLLRRTFWSIAIGRFAEGDAEKA